MIGESGETHPSSQGELSQFPTKANVQIDAQCVWDFEYRWILPFVLGTCLVDAYFKGIYIVSVAPLREKLRPHAYDSFTHKPLPNGTLISTTEEIIRRDGSQVFSR